MIRKLAQSEWQEYVCDELWPVLSWLDERYKISISEVILDIKGVYTDIYVNGILNADVMGAAAMEFPATDSLRIGDDWFSCPEHYCSIQSKVGQDVRRTAISLTDRIRSLFASNAHR